MSKSKLDEILNVFRHGEDGLYSMTDAQARAAIIELFKEAMPKKMSPIKTSHGVFKGHEERVAGFNACLKLILENIEKL